MQFNGNEFLAPRLRARDMRLIRNWACLAPSMARNKASFGDRDLVVFGGKTLP